MTGIAACVSAEQKLAFQLVVAATRKLGIGKDGTMPWKLPGDMAYFKRLTSMTADPQKMNAVVRSIPCRYTCLLRLPAP